MSNPWLSGDALEASASTVVPRAPATGPTAPQQGVTTPERADQLPVRDQPFTARLWVLGVHGGAGESTLAALEDGWRPADHAWPRTRLRASVLLVARSSAHGLVAAQTAARQWAAGQVAFVDVVGLAVLADAPGRLPRPLRDLAQVVGGGVPRVWHLPWIEAWRLGEHLASSSLPRQVRRLLDDVAGLTTSSTVPGASVASDINGELS